MTFKRYQMNRTSFPSTLNENCNCFLGRKPIFIQESAFLISATYVEIAVRFYKQIKYFRLPMILVATLNYKLVFTARLLHLSES